MQNDQIQFVLQMGALGILAIFMRAMWMLIAKQADDCKKEIRANRDRIIELHNRIATLEADNRKRNARQRPLPKSMSL